MIKFSLVCRDGHEFEAWFKSGAASEMQIAAKQVTCPHCGDTAVDKAVMAPAIARREDRPAAAAARPAATPPQAYVQFLRKVRDEIHAKAEYVGGRFAEEARRIHFDESDARGIYGEATAEEVKELAEDGIPFMPVPRLPEDLN
ncbi:DUF1178 family protein [Hyphomicrobium sp. CS1GBMeth3]|uniref:DUF1178 family protein n=1 Tax=Hyphomicrobium sp. CS1GBMeth3 TaxID=1892845 RepID=UPI0009309020|nr:DUF1178 family protein [Hyphomicrobium sp. CS1GBMeth3]